MRKTRWESLIKRKNELLEIQNAEQAELLKAVIAYTGRLNKVLVPAVCAIRRELDLPFDDGAYHELMERHTDDMIGAMEALMRDLEGAADE